MSVIYRLYKRISGGVAGLPRPQEIFEDSLSTQSTESTVSIKSSNLKKSTVLEDLFKSKVYDCAENRVYENLAVGVSEDPIQEDYSSPNAAEEYACNECEGDILGFRYVCLQCHDFDLCDACEGRGSHGMHYILRVPKNRTLAEVRAVLNSLKQALDDDVMSSTTSYDDMVTSKTSIVERSEQAEIFIKEEPSEVKQELHSPHDIADSSVRLTFEEDLGFDIVKQELPDYDDFNHNHSTGRNYTDAEQAVCSREISRDFATATNEANVGVCWDDISREMRRQELRLLKHVSKHSKYAQVDPTVRQVNSGSVQTNNKVTQPASKLIQTVAPHRTSKLPVPQRRIPDASEMIQIYEEQVEQVNDLKAEVIGVKKVRDVKHGVYSVAVSDSTYLVPQEGSGGDITRHYSVDGVEEKSLNEQIVPKVNSAVEKISKKSSLVKKNSLNSPPPELHSPHDIADSSVRLTFEEDLGFDIVKQELPDYDDFNHNHSTGRNYTDAEQAVCSREISRDFATATNEANVGVCWDDISREMRRQELRLLKHVSKHSKYAQVDPTVRQVNSGSVQTNNKVTQPASKLIQTVAPHRTSKLPVPQRRIPDASEMIQIYEEQVEQVNDLKAEVIGVKKVRDVKHGVYSVAVSDSTYLVPQEGSGGDITRHYSVDGVEEKSLNEQIVPKVNSAVEKISKKSSLVKKNSLNSPPPAKAPMKRPPQTVAPKASDMTAAANKPSLPTSVVRLA